MVDAAPHAIIIGAGIGGLTAALALRQTGFAVTVLERRAEIAELGAGLQLGPNATKVLDRLGIMDAVMSVASRPDAVVLRDGRTGRISGTVRMGDVVSRRHGAPFVQIHRADLLDCLRVAAAAAGAELHTDAEVVEVAQVSAPHVQLHDGRVIEADLVIGADGVRSGTRKVLFGGGEVVYTGQRAWRATVPAQAPGNRAEIAMLPGRHVVTYPLRQGAMVNIVAVEETSDWTKEGWTHPADPEALQARFSDVHAELRALLKQVDDVFVWGLFAHPPLQGWARGHVALLGDAAHPMLPFLAQGAGMAIEDAWVLAASLQQQDIEPGLQAYSARRLPRATRVQAASQANTSRYHMQSGALRFARHMALRSAGVLARDALLSRLDWLYGHDVTRTV